MTTLPTPDDPDFDPEDVDEAALIAALTGIDRDVVAQVLHAADAVGRAA